MRRRLLIIKKYLTDQIKKKCYNFFNLLYVKYENLMT